jgi:hypothetical protein
MSPPQRHICRTFHIDTNRVNARSCLVNMNKLEEWHQDDVISIEMSSMAQSEAAVGDDQKRKSKAYGYIYNEDIPSTPGEKRRLQEIAAILFPGGEKSENERNDVKVVFTAMKYEAILITNDGASKRQPGGILGNRERLKRFGIKILTDEEAVRLVQDLIHKRDERTRCYCERTGEALPDWVGKD